MKRLEKLISEYSLSAEETWIQLNEINQIDSSKFSEKEVKDIDKTIAELEVEYSMKKIFITELENLR